MRPSAPLLRPDKRRLSPFICQHLGERRFSADLGGTTLGEYVGRIVVNAPAASGGAAMARMIRDLWALRQIAAVADDIGRDASEGFEPTAYLNAKFGALDEVRAALSDRERTSATSGQAGREVVEWIESLLKGNAAPLPSTGIRRLDDEIGGGAASAA
jgi:replicative DNA helicase